MELIKLSRIFGISFFVYLAFGISSLVLHPSYGENDTNTNECYGPQEYGQQEYGQLSPTSAVMEYSNNQSSTTNNGEPSLSVQTDRLKYVPGEYITISGQVYDEKGCPTDKKVSIQVIQVTPEGKNKSILNTTSFSSDGSYSNVDMFAEESGKYKVEVSIEGTGAKAQNYFEVTNFFLTTPAYFMYIGVGFLAGLMILIGKGIIITADVSEILRFFFITGIVIAPIAALILTDVEIGTNSPVGLVKKPPLDENGQPKRSQGTSDLDQCLPAPGGQWVINVGGRNNDCYAEGIQIPINVAIFGMAGGYLRYLWKTAGLRQKREREVPSGEQEENKNKMRTWLFFQSLEDLAILFLSPLLAIAVWFILFQGGTTGDYGITVISFTVGLITEEVIQALIRFSGSLLRNVDTSQKTRTQVKDTEK